MSVLPFPSARRDDRGTIHVMGDAVEGFQVSHESASGNSWGALHGPYTSGERAISVAYALNRDEYGGACNVWVCDAAVQHANPGVGLPSVPGVEL